MLSLFPLLVFFFPCRLNKWFSVSNQRSNVFMTTLSDISSDSYWYTESWPCQTMTTVWVKLRLSMFRFLYHIGKVLFTVSRLISTQLNHSVQWLCFINSRFFKSKLFYMNNLMLEVTKGAAIDPCFQDRWEGDNHFSY